MSDAFVLDAVRTPRGRGRPSGGLYEVKPVELVVGLLDAVSSRSPELDLTRVDDLVLGVVEAQGSQGGVIARTAAMLAGLSESVPGMQLNRYCGSGLEAVNQATARIRTGWEELIIAGGVECMSREPLGSGGDPWTDDPIISSKTGFVPQGVAADLIASIDGVSRQEVDGFAKLSQDRAAAAWKQARFDHGVVPVLDEDGRVVLDRDEHIRPGTTIEDLAGLPPAFDDLGRTGYDDVALERYPELAEIRHVHTAGNSSGIVDGAALVVLGSGEAARRHEMTPRARICSTAVVASEPTIMLTGPGPASFEALRRAGMTVEDVDLVEINEAFASVALRLMRDLEIDETRTNVNGGAIAMGHPLGATGAMLLGTIVDELERRDEEVGLVTLCIGGGMGIATVVERV